MPEAAAQVGLTWLDIAICAVAVVVLALLLRYRWYRLRSAIERPEIVPPLVGLAMVLAMMIAGWIALAIGGLVADWPAPDSADDVAALGVDEQVQLTATVYVGQGVIALAYVAAVARRQRRRAARDRRWPRRAAALLGAVALLAWWPVVTLVALLTALFGHLVLEMRVDDIAHETLRALLENPVDGWLVAMGAMAVLVAPVMEEVLYRGLLQESLRRLGLRPWPAIILTSVLFASMHMANSAPHAVVALFALSLGFGWAFERTGRLTAPIVMHVLFNAGNVLLAVLVA